MILDNIALAVVALCSMVPMAGFIYYQTHDQYLAGAYLALSVPAWAIARFIEMES